MKTRIVRIGNSQGIRIPKPLLREAGIEDAVELRLTSSGLVLEPVDSTRAGWADSAKKLADTSPAEDQDVFTPTAFDDSDWEW